MNQYCCIYCKHHAPRDLGGNEITISLVILPCVIITLCSIKIVMVIDVHSAVFQLYWPVALCCVCQRMMTESIGVRITVRKGDPIDNLEKSNPCKSRHGEFPVCI